MVGRTPNPPFDRLIAELALGQYGLITPAQLLAIGMPRRSVENRLRDGRLHVVHRGVYAVGHRVLSARARWLAAVLACGDAAVLSCRSAAALWGLRPSASTRVDVTVPTRAGRSRREGIVVHRTTSLPNADRTIEDSIPVTSPARTLLDLAELVPRRQLEVALDRAEQLRLFDLVALRAVVRSNPGRVGAARLSVVLNSHRAGSTVTESELKELFLSLCDRAGLPRPEVGVYLGRYKADFLWAVQPLIVETDGHS